MQKSLHEVEWISAFLKMLPWDWWKRELELSVLEFPQVYSISTCGSMSPWTAAGHTWGTADSLYVLYDTGIAASIITGKNIRFPAF